ncbi:hypothetical protein [Paraburkholderia aromaticivorans]|uniref:Uncharacterized protein n=1 Tax=Paraburkholderia aromaticivorans TaxID=2026199 RepID=A0A248VY36_9BURK|nr:hypothetical protein [Paraburkholderia aromaticivorans]ASW03442.1 hypothetical protein CJU94_35295 [Paraburkholderia aromaticivorans]
MITPILQSVEQACNDFSGYTGVPVSRQAAEFIAEVISLITEDPHPRWNVPGANVERLTQAYEVAVPIFLYQILKQMDSDKGITAFDAVHWLATNLDQFICVIKK